MRWAPPKEHAQGTVERPLNKYLKNVSFQDSLVVQWLRLGAPNAGNPGSIPGQGTRAHMPQVRSSTAQKSNKYFPMTDSC